MPILSSFTARTELYEKFKSKITHNPALDRNLVSYQGNKQTPFSSWLKYREGFSERLVTYILQTLKPNPGILIDPFSGSGTALFTASALGWISTGIELLPVGIFATEARIIAQKIDIQEFKKLIYKLHKLDYQSYYQDIFAFNHLTITRDAFSEINEKQLVGYLSYCNDLITDNNIQKIMIYAAFCILEDISYTRKDGQYLRWDFRSGRSKSKSEFNKGAILSFEEAIERKLKQIISDLELSSIQLDLFNEAQLPQFYPSKLSVLENSEPKLYQGSCLEILPTFPGDSVDCVITSPPYLNRYDYTRIYALELAFLGCDENKVKNLRQQMLSCTVENRDKRTYLEEYYKSKNLEHIFLKIDSVFKQQDALQEILIILEKNKNEGTLNNKNISRMVHNYFYEMCFVIYELSRILKSGGIIAIVNDNVKYAGEEIPVDLILSDIAESFGLTTRYIWTLGRGKGNSSQQMGNYGRTELRKCVYIWEK
ncbi:site-specific DNA-methyltransferase [Sphaerospermopsis aphanizomenoides BCCUSP55]|uniref:site-specific DNA-methyltransferase n=1 Tax=Sphaerospermopsis aphanizomenoides TaxID=459663 RepID=UPI0019053461|nr:site-specific DNA-methyltransferase [Sphaerospermopsis aphanizomenoides]MBK1989021.1 site-specific DNA-methyltransferase [Sphaerospermopsis aphanizomenoides BCCUSP55]